MPYMQRLTWKGVAMHAGHLPGYAASHGCIRLPLGFAKLLYGVTKLGTPVMITDAEQERRAAEYELANQEYARKMAEQHAAAERVLAEFDTANAAYKEILRRHTAEMAKYTSDVVSK